MEVMCRSELVAEPLPYVVSPDATVADVLRDVCALFGREEKDAALEVDGVEVCASDEKEDVEVGSLGLHADSSVVLRLCRKRVLALVQAGTEVEEGELCGDEFPSHLRDALPAWVWDDETVMAAAAARSAFVLVYASVAMRDSESVVMSAVKKQACVFKHASRRLRDTDSIVAEAVSHDGYALKYASIRLKDSESIVTAALETSGQILIYAGEKMQDTESVVLNAVCRDAAALQYASDRLRDTVSVFLPAVTDT
eukprot:Rhum_TRINITY_DN15368_c0_g2::Rhum_TRINITY_DN15368_c0_g2_i1::g.152866::m.152866